MKKTALDCPLNSGEICSRPFSIAGVAACFASLKASASPEPGMGIIQSQRIQGSDLHASNACCFHLFEFPPDFCFCDSRPEPPPAHHDPAVIRRVCERLFQPDQTRIRLRKTRGDFEPRKKKQNAPYYSPGQGSSYAASRFSLPSARILPVVIPFLLPSDKPETRCLPF